MRAKQLRHELMRMVLKTIYYGILIALGAIALLLVASLFSIPGNFKVKVVLSGSMEPTIKTGSIIVLRAAPEYRVGDIITFGRDTQKEVPVTHRIIAEKDGAFITRGDANDVADTNLVQKRDIIGREFLTIPYVGYAVSAAKTPIGFVILILIPACIIVVDEVRKIWKEVRAMRNKKREHTDIDEAPPPPPERRRMVV